MDLGPNPVEAILAMLRGKGEPGDASSAAQESSPNETARAKAEPKAEPDPEPPDEYIDEGWWRELDEPPVDAGTAVDVECAADVQMNAEVYDPGFDAIVGAPAAASSGAVRVERPIPKGERQTKLPF